MYKIGIKIYLALFWSARELYKLLGYVQWRNFLTIIGKAKTACENAGMSITDHFVDVNKMVNLGSGSLREVDNILLTRYACYLVAQNGDSRKPELRSHKNTSLFRLAAQNWLNSVFCRFPAHHQYQGQRPGSRNDLRERADERSLRTITD